MSGSAESVGAERAAGAVLVTGARGYIGGLLLKRLAGSAEAGRRVVAMDLRPVPERERRPGVHYLAGDIRAPELGDTLRELGVEAVVHLAFTVTPGRGDARELAYSVDVLGTRNVLEACVAAGVKKLVVTSSGAAYGYHPDNPVPLRESDPLRGNREFAYAHHKRLVEEMLARHREEHPELEQFVFRVCTILGDGVANQITRLFERRWVIDVAGASAPFVFIWDEDLVSCLVKALSAERGGIYNVAADGDLSMEQIARILGKRYVALPVGLLKAALCLGRRLGLSAYGPEQTLFLQHRPVLANQKLKSEFGFTPTLTAAEVFDRYLQGRKAGFGH